MNFVMNAILSLSSVVFPLITYPYVFRILQPAGTGSVSFAVSLISYFNMIAQLGIATYGIRRCAQVRDDREALSKTAQELLLINLIMTAIAYAALIVTLFAVPQFHEDRILYVVISANILLTTIGMEWLYRALEQYVFITVRSLIFKAIAVVCMFLMIRRPEDYVIYGALTVLAGTGSYLLNFLYVHRFIDLRLRGSYDLRQHMKAIFIFFGMSCATTIYLQLDVLMLGFLKTKVDVGYYDVAVRIKVVLVNIVTALGAVLLPRSSYYVEQGRMEEFRNMSKKALHFVWLFALPLTLFFILFAGPSVRVLSGDAYIGAIAPMRWIMPTLIFIGITNILGIQIMIPLGMERHVLCSEIWGAIVDLLLNAILIPRLAAAGAAIGTLAAEAAVLLYQSLILKSRGRSLFRNLPYLKSGLACACAAGASVWILFTGIGDLVSLLAAAVIFFVVYGIVLICTRETFILEQMHSLRRKISGGA